MFEGRAPESSRGSISLLLRVAGALAVSLLIGLALAAYAQPPATLTLVSPNPQFSGEFGYSVAIGGGVVAVGAPEESISGYTYSGRAYVFDAGTGALVATIASPAPQSYGEFGYSVALNGGDLVVGGNGNAYVFNARTGDLIGTLTSPNSQDLAVPGYTFATGGGIEVVGTPLENVSGVGYAGRANITDSETGSLIASLTSPNAQDSGEFGYAVAAGGSIMVVDAPGESVSGNASAGRAYVFDAESGALAATLASPNSQFYGNFGYSVAVSGDTVIVGAPGETVQSDTFAGRAYVFEVPPAISISHSTAAAVVGQRYWTLLVAAAAIVAIAVAAGGLVLRRRRMSAKLSARPD